MTTNIINQVAYLPTSRNFPREVNQLIVELDKSYIDIANAVNNRIISIFPTNVAAINGESWFLNNERQQGFRQIYSINNFAAFDHNLNFNSIATFTAIRGIGFDGANYYPIPYINPSTPAASVGIYVTTTQVTFIKPSPSPAIVSGIIILEWISQV